MSSKCVSEANKREVLRAKKYAIRQSQLFNHQNKKPFKTTSSGRFKHVLISKTTTTSHPLNLPLQTEIYKDLIPVNVNNSVLEDIYPKKKKQRSYARTSKDPEPVLGDFLIPIKALELKIEKSDSRITLNETETLCYNRFYELFKALNVDS